MHLIGFSSCDTTAILGVSVSFKKRAVSQRMHELLEGDHSCIVMITCGEPTEEGQMPVEMVYEGDPNLADFLLHSAQEVLQRELEGKA